MCTAIHRTVVLRAEQEGFTFIPEVDYTLFQLGGLTQVIVLGGSRIELGMTVFVSYKHAVPPLSEQSIFTGSYSLSLTRKGFSLVHRRALRDGGTTDAAIDLLGRLDESSTTVRLHTQTPLGRLDLSGSRRDRATASYAHTSYDVTASLALPSLRRTQVFVGASHRNTEAGDGNATVSSVFASMSKVGRWIRLQGRVEAMDWALKGGTSGRSLGADLNADMAVGASTLSVRYFYNVRFEPSSVTRSRVTVRVVRKF
ncbi:MAG: hypothetical protein ACC682_17195 [Gemmatimonadota bacterium]